MTDVAGDARLATVLTTFLPADNEEIQRVIASLESSLADTLIENAAVLGSLAWTAMCLIADQTSSELEAIIRKGGSELIEVVHARDIERSKASPRGIRRPQRLLPHEVTENTEHIVLRFSRSRKQIFDNHATAAKS